MHGQPLKSMDIRIIPPEEKEGYMPLLLIADPSPEMVSRYLHEALLFVGYESDRAVCCAAVKVEEGRAELMNLAVGDSYRHRGLASRMLDFLCGYLACQGVKRVILGTGSPGEGEKPFWQYDFYIRRGFSYSYGIKGFFADNYGFEILEDDGRRCVDMVYLEKILTV